MNQWIINLHAVGRDKVTRSLTVSYPTLPRVEGRALQECKKHLASRNVALGTACDLNYAVYAGGRVVGNVSIKTL